MGDPQGVVGVSQECTSQGQGWDQGRRQRKHEYNCPETSSLKKDRLGGQGS